MKKYRILLVPGFLLVLSFFQSPAQAGKLINDHLPEWLRLDVEFRHRFEFRDNFDFNESRDDEDGFHLLRTRVNIGLLPVEHVKFFAQFQDARISNDEFTAKAGFEDYADIRQLYAELNNVLPWDAIYLEGVNIRGGRQELSFGAQRLIGGFNWSNVAQTFDAAKVSFRFAAPIKVHIFGGTKTPNKSPRESDDFYDGSTKDIVGGAYGTWIINDHFIYEDYLIRRKTNKNIAFGPSGAAFLDEYTLGARLVGKDLNRFDFEVETAWQGGEFGDKDIDAWMAVAILGYTIDHPWKPRAAFEFDYASGDNDSSDDKRHTFDNLYPTNHIHYGYMDRASLQNLNNYRFQLSAKPTPKLKVQADLHLIYLDTAKDDLYSAGRATLRSTPAGLVDVDTHVGNELDLLVKYKLCDYANLLAGYSHFFVGDFIEETGPDDDGDFFYVQTTLKF